MPLRLLLGILGEVAQHEDDLVLHVERGVAVVAEVLALGDDDAVAGEDDVAASTSPLSENESARTSARPSKIGPAAPAASSLT